MTVNSSPSMSQISNVCKGSVTQVSMGDWDIRYLLGAMSGEISLSSAINKPAANSYTYSTAGTYSWLVVPYQNLSVTVNGAGGGGGGGATAYIYWYSGSSGAAGGLSKFDSPVTPVIGNGGGGGTSNPSCSTGGSGGGSGGTTTVGGGAAGGYGGAGNGTGASCPGGPGGKTVQSWTYPTSTNRPTWSTQIGSYVASYIAITVGTGGAGGGPPAQGGGWGGAGGTGSVVITWS